MTAGRLVPNQNLAAPLLAREVGGEMFLSFVSAIAFATILAVVAGLTIAASSAFAHDIWFTVVKRQQEDEREQVLVARVTAAVIGAGLDRAGDRAALAERRVPGRPRVRRRRERQRAGDPADALLAPLQHHRDGRRHAGRAALGGRADRAQSRGHGRGRRGHRGPPPHPARRRSSRSTTPRSSRSRSGSSPRSPGRSSAAIRRPKRPTAS